MDIPVQAKKGFKKKHVPFYVGGGILLLLLAWLLFGTHRSTVRVDEKNLQFATVLSGTFNDFVRVNGRVEPSTTIQVSALEGGFVEEKLVEEGALLKKGQVMVRLSNSSLSLSILESESQLAEKQNFLRNTLISMEQERLNLRQEKLQLDLDVTRKERKYAQAKRLVAEDLMPREEYLQAQEDYEFALRKRDLVCERQRQDSLFRSIQVKQMEESLSSMQRNLNLVRSRFEDLQIKAPLDGQLGLLDVEVGQSVVSGTRVGQIHVLSNFKMEAMIDEHYIDRISVGLEARMERGTKAYRMRVRKVYPDVRGSQFQTDLVFEGAVPENLRSGQSFLIDLQLGASAEGIILPKGAFYGQTGGQWIYVLNASGSEARKVSIKIGKQNPQYYEVLEGLKAGDRVITSGYENLGANERVIIRK